MELIIPLGISLQPPESYIFIEDSCDGSLHLIKQSAPVRNLFSSAFLDDIAQLAQRNIQAIALPRQTKRNSNRI